LLAALAGQVAFGLAARGAHPPWDTVEPPPPKALRDLMGFGDGQMLFRGLGLALQHAGDTGGRVTPLRSLDYANVVAWLDVLDDLDRTSVLAPMLAAFHFGQSPVPADVARVVEWLIDAAQADPARRWRYLAHGAVIAKHRVKDLDLALRAARALAALPAADRPLWTRQMPAFILSDMGEAEQAAAVYAAILKEGMEDLPPEEVLFMLRAVEHLRGESARLNGP